MPQLMPLNWMISSVLIMLVVISGCILYSEKMNISEVDGINTKVDTTNMNWCW